MSRLRSLGFVATAFGLVGTQLALAQTQHSHRTLATFSDGGLQLVQQQSNQPSASGSVSLTLTPEALRWRFTSDGSWIAESIGLGDDGAQVFTERGDLSNSIELRSSFGSDLADVVWSNEQTQSNFARQVVSSESGDVHVSVHQEYTNAFQQYRHAVLRKWSGIANGVPDWTYSGSENTINSAHTGVAVSQDGSTIVLLEYIASTLTTKVTVLDPATGAVVAETPVGTFGAPGGYTLSDDGSTLMIASTLKLVVVDLATVSVAYEDFLTGQPQYGALALSADGGLAANGTRGKFTLFTRDAQGAYAVSFVQNVAPNEYCRRLDISGDGSTLVAGLHHEGNHNGMHLFALDLATLEPVFDQELDGGGGQLCLISELECSYNGQRFAVGSWGDEDDLIPEVLVYSIASTEPILADSLPGSVLDLDFSADGSHLAVASKGTHASVWGGGGSFSLYRVGNVSITVDGAPRAGGAVTLEHHLRAGTQGRILVATSLAPAPIEGHAWGNGLLYLDPATLVELPDATAAETDTAYVPFSLATATPGTTYYLQGYDEVRGGVSRDYTTVTVLP
ncbi:MAG: hypothetical protein H6828_12350 [Planctomycetes bacterium]|nr:hypothetical protein [Planctomycetota bacterium]